MGRSRNGTGRHRQAWQRVTCPHCGLAARARRTLPGQPMYLRTHLDLDGALCPPLRLGETRIVYDRPVDPNQPSLPFSA